MKTLTLPGVTARPLALAQRFTQVFDGQLGALLGGFVFWRALLWLGAYVGGAIGSKNPAFGGPDPLASLRALLFDSWLHWDGAWYLSIILHGYSYQGAGAAANVAFFPLYPITVRTLLAALGLAGNRAWALIIGVSLSNLALLATVLVLYQLAKFEFAQRAVAGAAPAAVRAALYLLLFPTSIFFASMYPEALFVFLLVASFYLLRKGRFIAGGLVGALATLCRINGLALLLPFAIEYYRRWGFKPRRELLAFALIPLGTLVYCAYLDVAFHEPLAFLQVQSAPGWHGTIAGLPFSRSLGNVWFWLQNPNNVWIFLELFYVGLMLLLALLSFRRLPAAYGAFALAVCAVPLVSDTWSIQRYVLAAFPVFMTLGLLTQRPRLHSLLTTLFAFMLGVSAIMWINGVWLG